MVGWDAMLVADARRWSAPSTPTRPTRSPTTSPTCSGRAAALNQLAVRIAVSEAAAWTGRRLFGGALPRSSPTASTSTPSPARATRARASELRIAFVGQAVERKGLPVLLRAFEALREHVPGRADDRRRRAARRSRRCCSTPRGVRALGQGRRRRASARGAARGRRALRAVARRRELRHGPDRGVRGGHAGHRLRHRRLPRRRARRRRRHARPARRRDARSPRSCATSRSSPSAARAMAAAAAERAERYAWPRVADEVVEVYERRDRGARARAAPRAARRAVAAGVAPPPTAARERPRRGCPALEPRAAQPQPRAPLAPRAPRWSSSPRSPASAWPSLALQRIGIDRIAQLAARSQPDLGAGRPRRSCALSMVLRALVLARDPARRAARRAQVRAARRPAGDVRSACSCPRRCPPASASPSRALSSRAASGARARRFPSCSARSSRRRC